MSRADAWSDAIDIYNINQMPLWALASEVAERTSLSKYEAEGKLVAAIVADVGELLYEFGGYGEVVDQ
jgi:hypothetical protein